MPWVEDPTPVKLLLSCWGIGMIPLSWSDRFFKNGKRYFFQRTNWGLKIRRLGSNLANETPARLVQREKMRVARERWQALTEEEKGVWRLDPRCHQRRIPGYCLFISLVLKGKI